MQKLMLGNEAIARGIYEAGVTVVSSYPGTPSTEITEYVAKYDDIYTEWAPNEKVAMEVVVGASIGGARTMCAMKHVGLNVAADPLFTASYTGVNGGMVIIVADDPGMHSSQNEQDSRYYAKASKIPMLEPSDSQECKDFAKAAFTMSEQFDTPVIIRLTTRVAHSQSVVVTGEKVEFELKEYKKDSSKYVMIPSAARKRHVVVEERMNKLSEYANTSELNNIEWGNTEIGVITSGVAYQYVREALGEDVSVLKLGMVHPLPKNLIQEFTDGVKELYIVEELEPVIETFVKEMGIYKVTGKDKFSILGELTSKVIKETILNLDVEETESISYVENLPVRPPILCPGCPHRGMFHVFKKLKLNVMGDIGCYTLGSLSPLDAMDACLCMGASIPMTHGMDKARGEETCQKTVGILGDSTFIHSGITGIIDIVYNRGESTIVIADNSITGMTGHQHNPTTGYTIKNEPTNKVDLVKLLNAVGVERVKVVDPFNIEGFTNTLKEELKTKEPSVIISQRPCALLKSVKRETPRTVVQDNCKKCKMCLSIGCPAIENRAGTILVNEILCSGCGLCARVCKFGALKKVGEENV